MHLIPSGIAPLDDILGGLVAGRAHIVVGSTGTGKTAACLHFLDTGIKAGQRTVLLTTDDPADLLSQARFMGIDLPGALGQDRLVLLLYQPDFVRRFGRAAAPEAA